MIRVESVAFNPYHDELLLSTSTDGSVHVWDATALTQHTLSTLTLTPPPPSASAQATHCSALSSAIVGSFSVKKTEKCDPFWYIYTYTCIFISIFVLGFLLCFHSQCRRVEKECGADQHCTRGIFFLFRLQALLLSHPSPTPSRWVFSSSEDDFFKKKIE